MTDTATPEIRLPSDAFNEAEEVIAVKGKPSAAAGLSLSNKLMRSLSGNPTEVRRGSSASGATDPITQSILERKSIEYPSAQKHHGPLSPTGLDGFANTSDASSPVRQSLDRRPDESLASNLVKDKKARVSFLSRLRTGGKKRDSMDLSVRDDEPPDLAALRSEGTDAAVFSQPMGYIPKFQEPPKYIKVRARGKDKREFDHLFLAQELRGRTGVEIAQAGGHKINVQTKMKHDNASWAMEFSKDGHYLAAGGQGHVVRVWAVIATEADRREEDKAEEGNAVFEQGVKLSAPIFKSRPVQEYEGHTASILAVSWSKNNFLLSSSMDKTVRLWHVSREECLCVFKHPDYVPAVQFHPQDDRFFLAGSLDSKLRLWSIPDKSVAYSTLVSDLITAVAFTPDGKTIMAGTLSGLCVFYDTEKLREQTKMHVRSAHGKNAKGSKITGIEAINFPPDDPKGSVKLLITSNDSRVRIYNMRDKSLELKLKGNENATSQIRATFSDDARHIICGSEDKKCYIWDMCRPDKDREKHPMETFDAHNEIVTAAIMAPAATKQLLQASGDPVFEICNPPPVQLLSKEETKSVRSIKSSGVPSETGQQEPNGNGVNGNHFPGMTATTTVTTTTTMTTPLEPPSSFKTRSSHPGGHIIITADTEGRVKCFRSDCAYKNRLRTNESWDTGSTFSKKVLHRSSSIATRASRNSTKRDSLIGLPSERIISWRQSIDRSSLPPLNTIVGGGSNVNGFGANLVTPIGLSSSAGLGRSSSPRARLDQGGMSPRKSLSGLSGLSPVVGARRLSGFLGVSSRTEAQSQVSGGSSTAHHPLSTSMSNTPITGSAAASEQSLGSAVNGATVGVAGLGVRDTDNEGTVRRRPDRRPRIGSHPASVSTATGDTTGETTGEEDEFTDASNGVHSDDDEDDNEEEYGDDDEEEEEEQQAKCLGCGGDKFRMVRRGKAVGGGMRAECARCGMAAG